MKLKNCKRCGKLFVYNGIDLCPDCIREDEEDFKKVKDFLYQYPKASVFEISEATGVAPEKILNFLKQGKLEISSDNTGITLTCERCGRPINSGRFCEECLKIIRNQFEGLSADEQNKYAEGKFHISDRIKKGLK
ncbi:MAG: MerR family transcriptional regulator [Thermoanaerobacteraceae bacterium]|nr:MerR family transcriptional regulator [Thermoanaerobacteraceae bacterium]